jgi:hypothetical protein
MCVNASVHGAGTMGSGLRPAGERHRPPSSKVLASFRRTRKASALATLFTATVLGASGVSFAHRPVVPPLPARTAPSSRPAEALKVNATFSQRHLRVLTLAEQIRGLTPEWASRKLPVALRGVVTFYAPDFGYAFVQDASAGIFLNMEGPAPQARPGDMVEVEGVTGPGEFAPVVDNARIRVTGRAPLPVAPRFSVEDLLTGAEDAQWVELRGVVHSAELRDVTSTDGSKRVQVLLLRVASGRNHLQVWVQNFSSNTNYASLPRPTKSGKLLAFNYW